MKKLRKRKINSKVTSQKLKTIFVKISLTVTVMLVEKFHKTRELYGIRCYVLPETLLYSITNIYIYIYIYIYIHIYIYIYIFIYIQK